MIGDEYKLLIFLKFYLRFITSEFKFVNLAIDSPILEVPSSPIEFWLTKREVKKCLITK